MNTDAAAEVRAIRESLGQTQEQLAESVGVSVRTFRRWENGEQEVPAVAMNLLRRMGETK